MTLGLVCVHLLPVKFPALVPKCFRGDLHHVHLDGEMQMQIATNRTTPRQ